MRCYPGFGLFPFYWIIKFCMAKCSLAYTTFNNTSKVGAMNRNSPHWQTAGFALTTLMGTLFHFLYEWAGQSILVAPFSGVNESTWEHMKLLFWPMLFYSLFQWHFFRVQKNYWWIKLAQISLGQALIPILFYTYNGTFGKSPDWVNIAIFYVSVALAFRLEWWLFKENKLRWKSSWLAVILLVILAVCFITFTFMPPKIPLFRDPVTGNFGR